MSFLKGKSFFKFGILAHLWVKRKPCRGYRRLLGAVDFPMVLKYSLKLANFYYVLSSSLLNKKGENTFGL